MNSKSVILFGLLASLLLIFSCIFFNAEQYYKELGLGFKSKNSLSSTVSSHGNSEGQELTESFATHDDKVEANSNVEADADIVVATKEEDAVDAIRVEKKGELSSFNYYVKNSKTFISGKIPLLDNGDVFKEFIADCAKKRSCENGVTFFDYDETLSWKDFASSTLTLFGEEKISNPKLSIEKREIKIEGEFAEQRGKDRLLSLIEGHKSTYTISDMTTVKKELKKDVKVDNSSEKGSATEISSVTKKGSSKETSSAKEKSKVELSAKNLKQEQEKISELLKNSKINFKRNSGKIRKEGKKVLDKVAKFLKGKENILIEVQGNTDAGGKEKVNLWISQVRANGVKKYLIKKGVKANNITAKGYGEKKLLFPKTPYSPSNRRVEIHLKRK